MNIKLSFAIIFAGFWGSPLSSMAQPKTHVYQPDSLSLSQHPVPDWFTDAKLGIFIHWGLYSVPGYAPLVDLATRPETLAFQLNPYAEWYYNTMLVNGSPTQAYHLKTYGSTFSYFDFIPEFNREIMRWKPDDWAELFQLAGAKYVVLTAKHHDGFTLWKSKIPNPNFPASQPAVSRDIVGELTKAVEKKGLKMGLYYSGGLDWSFIKPPIVDRQWEKYKPQSIDYASYADAQFYELINTYHPKLLWNDIDYPKMGKAPELFAYFYNKTPEGVINNRWGVGYADFLTPEYETKADITPKKWEACRGMGNSFGYNRLDDENSMLSVDNLVDLLADVVSKNGNLLLNIGPKADGSIPAGQRSRLLGLGKWLAMNGESIFGTRPFHKAEVKANDGTNIRFTQKNGVLYLILLQRPTSSVLQLTDLYLPDKAVISMLGTKRPLNWTKKGTELTITLPVSYPTSEAYVLKITK